MRKVFVIAARDYRAAVKTKSFLISLLIMPIMMGGSILVQLLLKDNVDTADKRFAVVDRSGGQLAKNLAKEAEIRNSKEILDKDGKQTKPKFLITIERPENDSDDGANRLRYKLSEEVRKQELFGFLEIGPDVAKFQPGMKPINGPAASNDAEELSRPVSERRALRYQSNSATYDAFHKWARGVLNKEVQSERIQAAHVNLSENDIKSLLLPVELVSKGLSTMDEKGNIVEAPDENLAASFGVPAGMIFLMFMLILLGATPLMQAVVEEKMQRIAEVLLGSIGPFDLMLGKLLGMVGVSLTLAAVYLGGAFWAAHRYHFAQFIPTSLLIWFMVYQTLAVLMFGSLFIAIGAACSDMRETQSMTWPVMLLVCIPVFVWFNVIREPNSSFATGISLFPFATPMLMLGRQAVPPGIPIWQPILGVCLVLLTTALCVYAAGRIFRVGILMQGKGAHPGQMLKWVIRG
ncbi:MAG TPA: ABC transporter permease [Gemmataceae bacterium]|nr:ABC transporter permease [Gemmataceae bacterium]